MSETTFLLLWDADVSPLLAKEEETAFPLRDDRPLVSSFFHCFTSRSGINLNREHCVCVCYLLKSFILY